MVDINSMKKRYRDVGTFSLIGYGVAITSSGIRIYIQGDWKVINTKLFIKLAKIGGVTVMVIDVDAIRHDIEVLAIKFGAEYASLFNGRAYHIGDNMSVSNTGFYLRYNKYYDISPRTALKMLNIGATELRDEYRTL